MFLRVGAGWECRFYRFRGMLAGELRRVLAVNGTKKADQSKWTLKNPQRVNLETGQIPQRLPEAVALRGESRVGLMGASDG